MPSRRSALRQISVRVAAVAALGAGLLAWATRRPEVTPVRSQCAGGQAVNKKVLVAYATRAGSTAEVAQAISERLCAQGCNAEVRPLDAVTRLADYDAVVLGSAVRYGAWLPEMLKFVEQQRTVLARLPVAIYTLHMQALDDTPESRSQREKYTEAVRKLVSAREQAYFAGKIDPAMLSWFERLAVKMVRSPEGDRRDWEQIRRWADGLAATLA
jgi:menaquinone-dependent protoporphyrinogen oxidase